MQQQLEAILPPGFKFRPTKEELVGYYLFNKIKSIKVPHDGLFVKKCDLYGEDEPSDIWKAFRDGGADDDEDLYFYTDLKRKTANGFRIDRRVGPSGQGTWHGEDSGIEFQVKVRDEEPDQYRWITGCKKRFSYRNAESEQNGLWIMHEFSCSVKPDMVLCVLRRNGKAAAAAAADNSSSKKRKFSAEFDHQYKIARIDDHVEPLSIEYLDLEQLNHNQAQQIDETTGLLCIKNTDNEWLFQGAAPEEDGEELQRLLVENSNYDGCKFIGNAVDYEETGHVQQHDIDGTGLEEFYYSNSNFNPVDEVEHSTHYHQDHIANIDDCVEPLDTAPQSIEYPNWEQLKHEQELNGLLFINNIANIDDCVAPPDPALLSIEYPNWEQLKHEQELNGLLCINNIANIYDCVEPPDPALLSIEHPNWEQLKHEQELNGLACINNIAIIDDCVEPPNPALSSIEYPNWEQLKHEQELNGLVCINNNDSLSIPGAPTEESGDDFLQMLDNLDCSDLSWMQEFDYDGGRPAESSVINTDQQQSNNSQQEASDVAENGRNKSSHSNIDTSAALLQTNPGYLLSQDNKIGMIQNRF